MQAELLRYVGRFGCEGADRVFEFYLSTKKKGKLRGRYLGTGKYHFSFDLTKIELTSKGILFTLKGKRHRGRRIDESLEVTYPNGKKQYCPLLKPAETQPAQEE